MDHQVRDAAEVAKASSDQDETVLERRRGNQEVRVANDLTFRSKLATEACEALHDGTGGRKDLYQKGHTSTGGRDRRRLSWLSLRNCSRSKSLQLPADARKVSSSVLLWDLAFRERRLEAGPTGERTARSSLSRRRRRGFPLRRTSSTSRRRSGRLVMSTGGAIFSDGAYLW